MTLENTLFDLGGKTAIVTGASRGIGEAAARHLARHGANVIVSSRKLEACAEVANSINEETAREAAHPVACNISHREQLAELVAATDKKFGPADILVCNAAVNPYFGPSKDISEDQIDKILNCNIKANHFLSHLVLPGMKEKKDGSIIIISSIAGFAGNSNLGMYGISKAADLQLARNLAAEYGPSNIRVNCIAPGIIKTYFAEALWKDPAIEKHVSSQLPMRRFGEPDEIAGAIVFLASPAARYMTGQYMVIDGGTLITAGGM